MEEKVGLLSAEVEEGEDHYHDSKQAPPSQRELEADEQSGVSYKRRLIISIVVVLCCIFLITIALITFRWRLYRHRHKLRPVSKVSTDCGPVAGKLDHHYLVYEFKGIPYAQPPTGHLRWKPPVPLKEAGKCWKGTLKAYHFGSPCPQSFSKLLIGNEDCLYLNVLTPGRKKTTPLLPVILWIHGGDLTLGTGAETGPGALPGYSPNSHFVHDMNVVVVTINYRLNAFGFMALDVLSQSSPTNTSGNYGFMDQILALKWVQTNIHAFGGDRSKVTVIGQSSGATSIFALLAAESAQGLFRTVIAMSGSPVFNKTAAEASKDNIVFLQNSRCSNGSRSQILNCLYSLSTEQVLNAIPWLVFPYWGMEDLYSLPTRGRFDGALAVIDGDVVKYPPAELAKHQKRSTDKVTIVVGNVAQEIGLVPSYHFSDHEYEKYFNAVSSKLDKFMSSADAKKAVQLYDSFQAPKGSRPQYLYETLTTDLRAICSTDVLARNFSLSPRHVVYRYIATGMPSHQVTLMGLKPSIFAFHMWDAMALFGFKFGQAFVPQSSDVSFMDILRKQTLHFLSYGHPEDLNWRRFPRDTAILGNFNMTFVGAQGYHRSQCKFWLDRGFFSYSWIN